MVAANILKNQKIAISLQLFVRMPQNLVTWCSLTFLTLQSPKISKFQKSKVSPFWKNLRIASVTDRHHPALSILPNKTANIIKQKWNQFLLVVKATALKQQISNFYLEILSIEAFTFVIGHWLT